MKGLGSTFWALAFVLVALLAVGAAPANAAEPSQKLKQLQQRAADLYHAGSYQEGLQAAKQALTLAVQEFGPRAILPKPRANMPNPCAPGRPSMAGTVQALRTRLRALGTLFLNWAGSPRPRLIFRGSLRFGAI
jgi:hypothetical protein